MSRPAIEAVRALDRFLAESGTPEHQQTLQGILRSHEALYHAARVEKPDDGVVIIRDSAGVPLYAIETKTAKPAQVTDEEKLRVLADLLSYQLLPDVVREHLTAYRDALIEMPTPEKS